MMKIRAKRILAAMLAVAILVGAGAVTAFSLTDTVTFRLPGVVAAKGDTVEYPVSVFDNPGFSAVDLELQYDSSKLTLVSVSLGSALQGFTQSCAANSVLGLYDINSGTAGKIVLSLAYDADFEANGAILKAVFYVKAESGAAGIVLNVTSLANSTMASVTPNVEGETAEYYQDEVAIGLSSCLTPAGSLSPADYSKVDAALALVPSAADLALYNADDVTALNAAVTSVVRGLFSDRQQDINAWAQDIENAVKALRYKIADYTAVNAAVQAVPDDMSMYTPSSVASVNAAKSAIVYNLDVRYQAIVSNYATALNAAVAALTLSTESADYAAVYAAIARVPSDIANYTTQSVNALMAAITAVEYAKPASQQAQVNAFAAAINAKVDALTLKDADYSLVDIALAAVPADLAVYTEATAGALNSAIADVVRGKKIDEQETVNAYAAAINAAVAGLELAPASYSAVDAALARVPSAQERALYSPASLATLDAAVAAVVRGYNVLRQGEVDAMAAAINSALNALQYLPADYSKVNAAISAKPSNFKMLFYSSSSKQRLTNAVNAVKWDLTKKDQAVVDGYATAITKATNGLTLWIVSIFTGDKALASEEFFGFINNLANYILG